MDPVTLEGEPTKKLKHRLHPQHKLKFVEGGAPFLCNACTYDGIGNRYSCRGCDFDLHQACAVSDDILAGLIAEKAKLIPSVHEHQLSLGSGSSYTCNHCCNESDTEYRYNCLQVHCKMKYDLICVTHPTQLLSFLHPNHELELKTRPHFKKCSVCGHGGVSHARVYTCEECDFHVHPACAMRSQYTQHALHGGEHTLAFVAVPSEANVVCMACRTSCQYWCYLCTVCKESVYFHPGCLYPENSSSNSNPIVEGLIKGGLDAIKDAVIGSISS